MRRMLLVVAAAAMMVTILGVSAGPALADKRDHGRFHDRVVVLDDEDDIDLIGPIGLHRFDDRDDDDDDDGGPICGWDEDLEAELTSSGFECVRDDDDEDEFDDLHFIDDHNLHGWRRFDDHHGFGPSFVD